jgi:hypothetical protein
MKVVLKILQCKLVFGQSGGAKPSENLNFLYRKTWKAASKYNDFQK